MPAVRGENPELQASRYLPQVALATLAVVGLPLAVVAGIQFEGGLRSPWLSMLVAVVLSVAASSAGSAIWMRRPGSRDLVFGDLMLWGYIRRLRADRRIASTAHLLGDTPAGGAGLDVDERMEGLHLLGSSLESRDPYTHGHTKRVTRYSEAIARGMGLSHEQVARIRTAAALHDVGKVLTPRAILTRPGALTAEEFEVVKRHAADGAQMVATLDDDDLTATVRHHHERLDGCGYPDGLEGSAIPQGARIVAVADTFDAMTSSRPYRRARSHKDALDALSADAGSKLDADAVAAFIAYYSGRRTVAWGTFGIAAPQRLLAWVIDAGAAPVAKGIYTAGAAALIGSSLAMPELPPDPDPSPASSRTASASPGGPGPGRPAGPGDRPAADRTGPAAGRPVSGGGGPRTQGPGSRQPTGAGPGAPFSQPGGGGNGPQGGGTGTDGPAPATAAPGGGGPGGGGSGSGGGGVPVPTEVSVPGTQTPAGGVELQAPGVDANVKLPQVQLPGVKIELPAVELPGVKIELPLLGPR